MLYDVKLEICGTNIVLSALKQENNLKLRGFKEVFSV